MSTVSCLRCAGLLLLALIVAGCGTTPGSSGLTSNLAGGEIDTGGAVTTDPDGFGGQTDVENGGDAGGTASGDAASTDSSADTAAPPRVAAALVASAETPSTKAGAPIVITCVAQDAAGQALAVQPEGVALAAESPLEKVSAAAGLGLAVTSKATGSFEVRCVLDSAGISSKPIQVSFTPGDPAGVVAVLATNPIVAGSVGTTVQCQHQDKFGNAITGKVEATIAADEALSVAIDVVTGKKAGAFDVWCVVESAAVQSVKMPLTVEPADPAFSKAVATPTAASVDDPVSVACTSYDAFGNANVPQPTDWKLEIPDGCKANGLSLSCTKAGKHEISCVDASVPEAVASSLTIAPGPATTLELTFDPEQKNYGTGQVVGMKGKAADAYGNPIADPVLEPIQVQPTEGVKLDATNAQVSFGQDGLYTITVGLQGGGTLSASRKLRVDTSGPLINVSSPPRGHTMLHVPTTTVTFSVVDELSALAEVFFDDKPFKFGDGISEKATVTLDHGVNIVKIEGKDEWGNASTHAQAIVAAKKFASAVAGSSAQLAHGLGFWLGQQAIDSGLHVHSKPRDLATVMEIVLKNLDLSIVVGQSFPVSVTGLSGDATVKTFSFGDASKNGGYPKIALAAKTGGLDLDGTIWKVVAKVNLKGKGIGFIPVNVDATVTASSLNLQGFVALSASSGKVFVATKNVKVDLVNLDVNIDNKWGFLVNWLLDLFDGSITKLLENTLASQIGAAVDGPLGDALTGIGVQKTFQIPGFFGGKPTDVTLDTAPLSLLVYGASGSKKAGAWLKLDTSLTSKKTTAHKVLGVPMRRSCLGNTSLYASFDRIDPLEVAMHFDLVNQLFTAIWQAGGLDLTLDGAALAGLDLSSFGVGTLEVAVDMWTPPMLSDCTAGGKAELQLGDVQVDVKTTLDGQPVVVRAFISAKVGVAASKVTGEAGPELGMDVLGIVRLEVDVDQVLVGGVAAPESTVGFFEKLMPFVTNALVGALTGTLASFPLPELDLSAMATSIPQGTVLALDIQKVGSRPGHVQAGGGVAK
ncbi:MAG: hypothetical protein H6747_14920 [Deltaproteobacteria bacterium]|nr:hypothetical protein [Deltaproteobacteria bacterium]